MGGSMLGYSENICKVFAHEHDVFGGSASRRSNKFKVMR